MSAPIVERLRRHEQDCRSRAPKIRGYDGETAGLCRDAFDTIKALLAFAEAHDAYMLGAGYEGPEDTALHPNAAANWRTCRAAIARARS
jgi:hypothetical protein